MNFVQDNGGTASKFSQMDVEIVVGVASPDSAKSYSLHNVAFDHISAPAKTDC